MSVMPVPGRIAPGFAFGAALSKSTRDLPCSSLPVTTRRMGFNGVEMLCWVRSQGLGMKDEWPEAT